MCYTVIIETNVGTQTEENKMKNTTRKYQAQAQDLFGNWHNTGSSGTRKWAEGLATVTLEQGYATYGSARPTIDKVRIAIVGSTAHKQAVIF